MWGKSTNKKEWHELTKKQILKRPDRVWGENKGYESILLVPTKYKHETGYNSFAIVGCKKISYPAEVCCHTDVANYYQFKEDACKYINIKIDISMSGVLRVFSSTHLIKVDCGGGLSFVPIKEDSKCG